MQLEISRETLSDLTESLGNVIRGLKKIRKLVANIADSNETEAGKIGTSSPDSPEQTPDSVPGEKLPTRDQSPSSLVVPTLMDADLETEAVAWIHRSRISSATPGALPFGEEMMRCLLRNRIRGDRNHNIWVLYENAAPNNKRHWKKTPLSSLSLLRNKLDRALLACCDFVIDTKERPSRFNRTKWKRRMNLLKCKDSIPTVVQLEMFARSQHDMLPALRWL